MAPRAAAPSKEVVSISLCFERGTEWVDESGGAVMRAGCCGQVVRCPGQRSGLGRPAHEALPSVPIPGVGGRRRPRGGGGGMRTPRVTEWPPARQASPSPRLVGRPPPRAAIRGRPWPPPPPPPRPPRPPPHLATASKTTVARAARRSQVPSSSTAQRHGRGGGTRPPGGRGRPGATLAARRAARWCEDSPRRVASTTGTAASQGSRRRRRRGRREKSRGRGLCRLRSTAAGGGVAWAAAPPTARCEAEPL